MRKLLAKVTLQYINYLLTSQSINIIILCIHYIICSIQHYLLSCIIWRVQKYELGYLIFVYIFTSRRLATTKLVEMRF